MPITRQETSNNNMTPEAVRVVIDQVMQRNSTNGDGNHSSGGGPTRPVQSVRACSYSDLMKCQPLNFRGTEGVVGLSCWFEKIKSVFHISGCAIENQVKFATSTMLDAALTWGEIKKLEIKLWNLKVKGNDVVSYTQRFQELALMCTKFVLGEKEKVDKYIGGLPDNIHGSVMFARPKTLDEAIELANDLMDQKLRTYAERQTERVCWNSSIVQQVQVSPQWPVHYKNQNHGNQAEGTGARGMVYALGGGEINQDLDDIEDDINA
uniref:Reverse transcriptase domain-containing protein n=1 Tax=Tanacetum cinerariifolium TaxID=118510 RepID=A0A699HMA9_TANCI|nr:hypothetical protein [Tanacetum cinerariifolium]